MSITEGDIQYLSSQLAKKWSCRDVAKALGQDCTKYDGKANSSHEYIVILTTWLKEKSDDNCPKTCDSLSDTLSKILNSEIKLKKGKCVLMSLMTLV